MLFVDWKEVAKDTVKEGAQKGKGYASGVADKARGRCCHCHHVLTVLLSLLFRNEKFYSGKSVEEVGSGKRYGQGANSR